MSGVHSNVAGAAVEARAVLAAWVLASSLLAGCTTAVERTDAIAARHGWSRAVVEGAQFRHVVFDNGIRDVTRPLHVYLEGDGRPYLDRWTIASDPTPRRPVMLELMALDPGPAVLVGRPCYSGLARDPPCTPLDWTIGRFSERVVDSLASVIEQLRRDRGQTAIHLFGHSGGGALAVLLAGRLPGVERVVTLAGNLDPESWARHHDYALLADSLNPSTLGGLPVSVDQAHLAGELDDVVPAWMIRDAARRLGTATVEIVPGVAHSCCWAARWRRLLEESP